MACRQPADGTASEAPVRLTILLIAIGLQYLPRAATVSESPAMSSGEVTTEPSVNEVMLSADSLPSFFGGSSNGVPSAQVTPRFAAVLTTLHRPTFCSRSAENT